MSAPSAAMSAPTPVTNGVWMMQWVLANGFGYSMTLVRLPDGGLLIHSPIIGDDASFAAIDKLGEVKVLFAPNHFHRLSLPKFVARYPNAALVASDAAVPRLRAKGNPTTKSYNEAKALLPQGARFLDSEGTTSGESWLMLADGTLIVCDGFFNWTRPVTGLFGVLVRAVGIVPNLRVGKSFKWLQCTDFNAYLRWAAKTVRELNPKRVVFSHGEPMEEAGLGEKLAQAAERML